MNNFLPTSAIEGSSVLDISSWLINSERIEYDLKDKVLAAIKNRPGISYHIIEMMFDLRAEVFLKKLQAIK